MRDWPMLVGVSVLMIVGYAGAAWTLRDLDRPGPIRRAGRRAFDRVFGLRGGLESMTRGKRIAVLWALVVAGLLLTRAVFALAAAAHTEQGVIVGGFALVGIVVIAMVAALNTFRDRTRRTS